MPYCPKCGHEVDTDANYCYHCGITLYQQISEPMTSNRGEIPSEKIQEENSKTTEMNNKENAGFAAVLSIVFPGLGQFHNRQEVKGLVFLAIGIICLIFAIQGHPWWYLIFWVYGVYDAYKSAKKSDSISVDTISRDSQDQPQEEWYIPPITSDSRDRSKNQTQPKEDYSWYIPPITNKSQEIQSDLKGIPIGRSSTQPPTKSTISSLVSVIGVIVITVILAAVVAAFVFGMAGTVQNEQYTYNPNPAGQPDSGYSSYQSSQTSSPTSQSIQSGQAGIEADGFFIIIKPVQELASYLSTQGIPLQSTYYPYILFRKDGTYLVLTRQFTNDFSAGKATGTLYSININSAATPSILKSFQPKGVLITDSIQMMSPLSATVASVNTYTDNYAFNRVSILGMYFVSSTRNEIDSTFNTNIRVGPGILGDTFLNPDNTQTISTLDLYTSYTQLRKGKVIGVVLYPTKEIRNKFPINNAIKPVLLVESIEPLSKYQVKIGDLTTNLDYYDGSVVVFKGYTLGTERDIGEVITGENLPVDMNFVCVVVGDSPSMGSQILLLGLNSDLKPNSQMIIGCFEFEVAVTKAQTTQGNEIPQLFMISKKELNFNSCGIPSIQSEPYPTFP